jgi:Domain of unknown function DUF29
VTVTAPLDASASRWVRELRSAETLADDLGIIGASVGPRTGLNKRTKGDKEDYTLRRLLAAWRLASSLQFPVTVRAERERDGEPDFLLCWPDGRTLGVEVTEAGDERYQRWLTYAEHVTISGTAVDVPFEVSLAGAVSEFVQAITRKAGAYDDGAYRTPSACDLVVYNNTPGGKSFRHELVCELRSRNDLSGRFRQVHLVFDETVVVDLFGRADFVDVAATYEADYAAWIFDQVERLRHGDLAHLDVLNIAEELEDLGKSERRSLSSHIRNLIIHLLKHQFQPKRRTRSWTASIRSARAELGMLLTESPSLRRELKEHVSRQYATARVEASEQTGLPLAALPQQCPYELEQLLDDEFLPEAAEGGAHGE